MQDVTYARFAPPAAAARVVDHLWVVRYPAGTHGQEVLLPDGHGLVVVQTGLPGVLLDPLTQARTPEGSGFRGVAATVLLREQDGPATRLGAQLDPLALSLLGTPPDGAHRWRSVDGLLGADVVAACTAALDAGQDPAAARLLADGLAARLGPVHEDPTVALLDPVVREVLVVGGLTRATDLARGAELAVGTLHRWLVEHLGVPPDVFLAAVRFSAFVRDAVGPGPVRPQAVLAAVHWYVQAGYPPREVERFTGLSPRELRRLERAIAQALGVPAAG